MLSVKNYITRNNREVKRGNLVNYQLKTQRTLCKKIICYYKIWIN